MKSLIAVAMYPPRITYTAVNAAITITQTEYGISNAIPKSLDKPLYTDAVYGTRKMNAIADAVILSALLSKRVPKKSGIVLEFRCCVMTFVRLPKMTQASKLPIKAFPRPIQVDARPYFHPNCPAYPTNTTAEKYEVP